jgi:hypothetical protein
MGSMNDTTLDLQVFCINIQKSHYRLVALMEKFNTFDNYDIILIQEPPYVQHGTNINSETLEGTPLYGFPRFQGWTEFHHPVTDSVKPLCVTYIRNLSTSCLLVQFRLDITDFKDICTVLFTSNMCTYMVCNIYWHESSLLATECLMETRKINWEDHSVLIMGDFNMHNNSWRCSSDIRTVIMAGSDEFTDWLNIMNIKILNNLDVTTFPQSGLIIDLMMTNDMMSCHDYGTITNPGATFHSDHRVLCTTIAIPLEGH